MKKYGIMDYDMSKSMESIYDIDRKWIQLQSRDWDHKQTITDIINNAEALFIVQKGYHDIPSSNTNLVKTHDFCIMIQDKENLKHYTQIIFVEDGLYYYSDTYLESPECRGSKHEIWTKVYSNTLYKLAVKYKTAYDAIQELERELVRVPQTDIRDCVDIVFGFGHLH